MTAFPARTGPDLTFPDFYNDSPKDAFDSGGNDPRLIVEQRSSELRAIPKEEMRRPARSQV